MSAAARAAQTAAIHRAHYHARKAARQCAYCTTRLADDEAAACRGCLDYRAARERLGPLRTCAGCGAATRFDWRDGRGRSCCFGCHVASSTREERTVML